MKFSIPKISTSILLRAREYFNSGIMDYKERGMKSEGALLGAFFGILRSMFSTLGAPNMNTNLMVKEDPPRVSPSSTHYNNFLKAISLDLDGSYADSRDVADAVGKHWNYSQSNRANFDSTMKDINAMLSDFSIVSQGVDSRDIWVKESFNNMSHVEDDPEAYSIDPASVDASRGICTLGHSPSVDILTPENILDINDKDVELDPGFVHSTVYYGRQYGIVTEDIPSDEGIREQVSTLNTWDGRTTRNLVDPDGADTFWEVEVTAREEVTGTRNHLGPHNILSNAGIIGSRVSVDDNDSRKYTYDGGELIYGSRSYPTSFFYDFLRPRRRAMRATLEITLKAPRAINVVGLTRRPEKQVDITGAPHTIYVENIEIRDAGSGMWMRVPTQSDHNLHRSTNDTVTTVTTLGSIKVSTVVDTEVPVLGIVPEAPVGRRRVRGVTSGAEPSIRRTPPPSSEPLSPADSQFSRGSTWSFNSRVVTAIRIKLYVEYPYKILYTMGQFEKITKARPISSLWADDISEWIFAQYTGRESVEGVALANESQSSNPLRFLVLPVLIATGSLLIHAAYKAWDALTGWRDPVVSLSPQKLITVGPKESSDMYRWAIAISDVYAMTTNYNDSSEFLSMEWITPQPVAEIRLYANHEVNGGTIDYYIVLGNGTSYMIQPWESMDRKGVDGKYIPKALFINSDLPEDRRARSRWGPPAYIDVDGSLGSFRLRALLRRGTDIESTPMIYDYKIQVIPKEVGRVRHVR